MWTNRHHLLFVLSKGPGNRPVRKQVLSVGPHVSSPNVLKGFLLIFVFVVIAKICQKNFSFSFGTYVLFTLDRAALAISQTVNR